jgi:mRNA-degrading endonuclease toxin of MazEF toxin-antitoxin module
VLVLSRPSLITALHTVTVAAITSTRRGSPTEVDLDVEEGLKGPCCVTLCNVFTVAQADLRQFVGSVSVHKMQTVCRALHRHRLRLTLPPLTKGHPDTHQRPMAAEPRAGSGSRAGKTRQVP